MLGKTIGVMLLMLYLNSFTSGAPENLQNPQTSQSINTIWTLIAAFLVFFMQAGFAMVETGFTRAKNAANVIMKNLMDFSIGTIIFWAIGFSVMFGSDHLGFLGTGGYFLEGNLFENTSKDWVFTFWIFQAVFAATAATIVSGAMAERTKFSSYLIYSFFITLFIYPISGHWAWGGLLNGENSAGWLEKIGFIDFAGSTVVHSLGGWAALAGAIVLGPRWGKYNKDGSSNAIPGHNIPLASLGVFILWLGWFGFNPGSTTSGTNLSISRIAVTTNLSATAGAIFAMITVWFQFGKPDTSMALNGALAGLVGITASCANVSPLSAIIIGSISGVIVVISIELIDKKLHIDDPVGAISVHGVCGAWGTIALGLFAESKYGGVDGLFHKGNITLLAIQFIGVIAIFFWSFGISFIMFFIMKKTIGIRASKEEQLKGLDIGEHGMESYSGFQIFSNE